MAGAASAGLSCSPRPRPTAVPPSTANATSLPTWPATSHSSCCDSSACQRALQATSAAAASALPPASPPATGIRLLIATATPARPSGPASGAAPSRAVIACAQRPHRAQRQVVTVGGTWSAPSPATVTLSAAAASTVTSSNSEMAWKTVTRPW